MVRLIIKEEYKYLMYPNMDNNIISMIGRQFGRLTVIKYDGRNKWSNKLFICKCNCGNKNTIKIRECGLLSGTAQSCGCFQKECVSKRFKTHGMYGTPEYSSWINMKSRCYNKNDKEYANYGGRGITVCDEWIHDFKAFYDYIGTRKSSKYSLDRINSNGNYETGNVRWATPDTQSRNQRLSKNNKTGYSGISINKKTGIGYIASISNGGKLLYLGCHNNIESAIIARSIAEYKLWGCDNVKTKLHIKIYK